MGSSPISATSLVWVLVIMIGLAVLIEAGFRLFKGRELHLPQPVHRHGEAAESE